MKSTPINHYPTDRNNPEDFDYAEDFKQLITSPIMSMDKIEWWLLKHSDYHKEISDFLKEHNTVYIHQKEHMHDTFNNPDNITYTDYQQKVISPYEEFLYSYYFVNEVAEYARKDSYFKEEMKEYHRIKHSRSQLINWTEKNRSIFMRGFPVFIGNRLNYDPNGDEVWIGESLYYIEFSVDWNHFSFTFYFIKIFNELFYDKEILPEQYKAEIKKYKKILYDFKEQNKKQVSYPSVFEDDYDF